MMLTQRAVATCTISVFVLVGTPTSFAKADGIAGDDVVMRAMVDEMQRSMEKLSLDDLPKPYFIQLATQDRSTFSVRAAYGGLLRSEERHNRFINIRTRVGSYTMDNTNVLRSFGQVGTLPLDDDYVALRHAIWLLLDQDYKGAVETLTRKEAYLKSKTVVDRPDDFSAAPSVQKSGPPTKLDLAPAEWEQRIVQLSKRFERYGKIQNSSVSFMAGTVTDWIVNSEGTRLRSSDTGLWLEIKARIQAPDGMPLSDSRTYLAETPDQLPTIEKMQTDIDEMCTSLVALSEAEVPEQYTGPILFEAIAAGSVFDALLADALCARPVPLGAGRWGDDSLEKKLGLRILPRSFQIFDDPGPKQFEGTVLAGAYKYDDEAVKAHRVSIVEKGILKNLVSARAPTKKVKRSTGHGRNNGFGDARATAGCLYVSDDNALSQSELKEELIQAARDEGLPFALRITTLKPGRSGSLGPPVYAYKVFVDDGREELVRGLQFLPVERRALKRILAAGRERKAYNTSGSVASTIIAPAILFEELELTKTETEFDKLPILPSPSTRP